MNNSLIQFACQHCQSWLTVPAEMAGVTGPCPKCGQLITSPAAAPAPVPVFTAPGSASVLPSLPIAPPAPAPAPAAPSPWAALPGSPAASLPQMPSMAPQPQAWPQAPAMNPSAHMRAPSVPLAPKPEGTAAWTALPNPPMAAQGPIDHGPALSPPTPPSTPLGRALGQLPLAGHSQPLGAQPGMMQGMSMPLSAPLSRPETVGGSRLSLLARQLKPGEDGAPASLPMQPSALPSSELPGANAPGPSAMPTAERFAGANELAFQQALPTGAHRFVPPPQRKASVWPKLVAAAMFLLLALGGGWFLYQKMNGPQFAVRDSADQPEVKRSVAVSPEPGVTPIPPPPEPKREYVVSKPPVVAPEPEKADPIEPAPTEPTPPRAVPVPDTEPAPPRAVAVKEEAPTEPMVAKAKPMAEEGLVEIGRSRGNSPPETSPPPEARPASTGAPSNLPPDCAPAWDALQAFLHAGSIEERLKHTQLPDQMKRKMELYYASGDPGPIEVDEAQYFTHQDTPEVGRGKHVIFMLSSRTWGYAVPIMVEQTKEDARVDWLAFVEFKDDMLNKFLANPTITDPVQFHLGIRRSFYFDEDVPDVKQKDVFEVNSPMDNIPEGKRFVFVPKGGPLERSLKSTVSWDKEMSWVIAELKWHREGTTKWVELTAVPQLNWYSGGSEPTAKPVR